jgi:large subunit ribosomal protein L9
MKIILLQDVKGIGKKFEECEVSDGYAMNSLIPRKLAVSTVGSAAATAKILKATEEKNKAKKEAVWAENITQLSGTVITIKRRANEQGHLFEKLTPSKICDILKIEKGIEISISEILLKEPIKEIGTFDIPIAQTSLTLVVQPLD